MSLAEGLAAYSRPDWGRLPALLSEHHVPTPSETYLSKDCLVKATQPPLHEDCDAAHPNLKWLKQYRDLEWHLFVFHEYPPRNSGCEEKDRLGRFVSQQRFLIKMASLPREHVRLLDSLVGWHACPKDEDREHQVEDEDSAVVEETGNEPGEGGGQQPGAAGLCGGSEHGAQ